MKELLSRSDAAFAFVGLNILVISVGFRIIASSSGVPMAFAGGLVVAAGLALNFIALKHLLAS
jgi:hypothetical protein